MRKYPTCKNGQNDILLTRINVLWAIMKGWILNY